MEIEEEKIDVVKMADEALMDDFKDESFLNETNKEDLVSNELLQEKIDMIEVLQEQLEKEKEKFHELNK